MDALYGFLIGFFASILAGMFGSGGAIITTPALRVLLGASPAISLGTTLPLAIPTALSSTLRYRKAGLLNWNLVVTCAGFGIAGAIGGSLLTAVLNLHILMLVTGAFVLYVAIVTLWKGVSGRIIEREPDNGVDLDSVPIKDSRSKKTSRDLTPIILTASIGLAGGFISGLLGIGGGIIFVPAFMYILHLPIKEAFANSLAVIAVVAVPGSIIHALLGHVSGWLLLSMILGTLPGGFIGATITIKSKERVLYILFGLLVGALGVIFVVNEIKCIIG